MWVALFEWVCATNVGPDETMQGDERAPARENVLLIAYLQSHEAVRKMKGRTVQALPRWSAPNESTAPNKYDPRRSSYTRTNIFIFCH